MTRASRSIAASAKSKNNVEKIGNSWFYTKNEHISSNYTGFGDNQYGTWYCRNRKLDYSATTVADGKNSRWLVQNGKVNYDYTGLCQVNDRYYQVSKGNVLWEVNDSSRMQLKSYYQEEIKKYGREDLSFIFPSYFYCHINIILFVVHILLFIRSITYDITWTMFCFHINFPNVLTNHTCT